MNYGYFCKYLPDELVDLIISFCCPETDYYRDKIIKISKDNSITRCGFSSKGGVDIF